MSRDEAELDLNKSIVRPVPLVFFVLFFYILYSFYKYRFQKRQLNIIHLISIILLLITLYKILFLNLEEKILLYTVLFIVPLYGFYLGLNLGSYIREIKKFLYNFCLVIISLQIVFTIYYKFDFIPDRFYLFTIYQNQQYFASILVLLSFYPLLINDQLKTNNKTLLEKYLLLLLVFIYVFLIFNNFSTIIIFIFGLCLFIQKTIFLRFSKYKGAILLFALCILGIFIASKFNIMNISNNDLGIYNQQQNKFLVLLNGEMPENFKIRIEIYKIFLQNINLIYGVTSFDLISQHKSSHNYFIECLYYFGAISMILIFYFLGLIFNLIIKFKDNKKYKYFLILFIVFIFIENLTKVSLRQIYSGVITFLFIGLFLSLPKKT